MVIDEKNLFIIIAALLILVSLIIILVILLQVGRRKKQGEIRPVYGEETVDESTDMDKTIAEYGEGNYDDEMTIDGSMNRGIKLQLIITFDGRTETVNRTLFDMITLGRGNKCDVDVVLGSVVEERKLTSRLHASIVNRPEGLYVKDEGARNKTYVNGIEVVGERLLMDEDVLLLGKAMVKINIPRF